MKSTYHGHFRILPASRKRRPAASPAAPAPMIATHGPFILPFSKDSVICILERRVQHPFFREACTCLRITDALLDSRNWFGVCSLEDFNTRLLAGDGAGMRQRAITTAEALKNPNARWDRRRSQCNEAIEYMKFRDFPLNLCIDRLNCMGNAVKPSGET